MKEVQAVILNLAFPKSLEEVLNIQKEYGYFDIEALLIDSSTGETDSWTVPKWCRTGDIVFFMHSKSSRISISALKSALKRQSDDYTADDLNVLISALERGSDLYKKYGGKIFAIGRVSGKPYYDDIPENMNHWKSKIYADVSDYYCLESPVDISEFNAFIQISSRSAITPVFGKEFNALKSLISSKNIVPCYFEESVSMPLPLLKVNRDNWIQITSQYRHSFFLEIQFRSYYVDYLLECIGDRKGFFRECACIKQGQNTSFVDNVIIIDGCYLPVEVKLHIDAEQDLIGQLRKYCDLDALKLDAKKERFVMPEKVFRHGVLVIDTEGVYWYNNSDQSIHQVCALDDISIQRDILDLRKKIISLMVITLTKE